ncbi:MAG: hypothetical protein HYR72_20375 [Deltaproteobacteria bacterium]|nr:hypothetical protein [Deltaproteobacteria bacterium]MBI3389390.1 hypothetical protein [Deltaproteobacteria bacterium]
MRRGGVEWLVPAALAAAMLAFTALYAADVPFSDSWDHTELIAGIRPLTLEYLWQQHNEHRLIYEKLLLAAGWCRATHWNEYGAAFGCTILLVLGGFVFLRGALRERPQLSATVRVLLVASLAGWLFTLRQWEHMVWSSGFSWGVLYLFIVLFGEAFRRYVDTGRGGWRVAVLVVATPLGLIHGLALSLFVLVFGALTLAARESLPRGYLGLCVVAGLVLATYFIGYEKPAGHPDMLAALVDPLATLKYVLIWLGSPFFPRPWGAGVSGIALVLAVLACLVRTMAMSDPLRALRDVARRYPLMIVGAIILAMTMVGRVGYGYTQAITPRYVHLSLLIVASASLFVFDCARNWPRRARTALVLVLLLVSARSWVAGSANAAIDAATLRAARLNYRDCVLAHGDDFSGCDPTALYPGGHRVHERTAILREHGLSFFRR